MPKSNKYAQSSELEVVGMPRINQNQSSLKRTLLWTAATLLTLPPSLAQSQVRLLPAPRDAHSSGEAPRPDRLSVDAIGHDAEDEFAARDLEETAKPLAKS